jgi:hypothetical protein
MRRPMQTMVLAGILAVGSALGLAGSPAKAQGFGGYPGGYYGGGYYGGAYGGYNPGFSYYGNGGHDFQPHWHTTQTPVGSFAWYGNGAHDLQPHEHTNSPYGGYRGYSPSPFGGVTTSYYNSTPYIYMPW